jgi:hypothetical protein
MWGEDFQMLFGNPNAIAKDPAYEGHNSIKVGCGASR